VSMFRGLRTGNQDPEKGQGLGSKPGEAGPQQAMGRRARTTLSWGHGEIQPGCLVGVDRAKPG
jgi:hypothetical protein